jgi:predicted dehydrogenase/threonine dehydrogenase-like Zn-dependent dehydrogenase
MKQIIQSYKTGKMEVVDVPLPACRNNGILIQNTASLISVGTEKRLIDVAKKSLLGKAKARPDLVKQVLNKMKKEGFKSTLDKVFTKLEVPVPLGYSCAGRVLMTGTDVKTVAVNDRVACAGAGFANHSEFNFIPRNLFVKVPDGVSDEEAAYTTVGSIALQGVRQLNPTMGEKIVVIGSGLIGLITVQLLKANGCDVLAVDIDQMKLNLAEKLGADSTCLSGDIDAAAEDFSDGNGVDGVIITASSKSKQVVSDAGEICRMRGRVIMVGFTPIDIPRDIYYQRELEFKLSMSYGPGRYDPGYEELGIDYPFPFVRWTEQRNMQTFVNLVAQRKIALEPLTTHRFSFENVLDAYQLISGKAKERYLGVILNYKDEYDTPPRSIELKSTGRKTDSQVRIGLIGSGNFAQSIVLPALRKTDAELDTLVNSGTMNLITASKKFGFAKIASDTGEIFKDKSINTVIITTRHNSHADLVVRGLRAGKHVFVEKPLAISEKELEEIRETHALASTHLAVGFNRRFSSHAEQIRGAIQNSSTPLVMNYIINAGKIEAERWVQNPEIGGGRIIGEVCHFIDFMQYVSGSNPVSVWASAIKTDNKDFSNHDSVQIILEFENGSIGNITYHAVGDTSLSKEYFELSGGGHTIKMYDFRRTEITHRGKTRRYKTKSQDKGFDKEFSLFFDSIINQKQSTISFESLYLTTLATFRILESIQTGLKLDLTTNKGS